LKKRKRRASLNNEFKDVVIGEDIRVAFIDMLEEVLAEREIVIIKARVLQKFTLKESGELLGVKKTRAASIEAKAMRKLRAYWKGINNKDSDERLD
jgi:DNA-directed RNA polymerase sigma subunit (sigma70/sigma32)